MCRVHDPTKESGASFQRDVGLGQGDCGRTGHVH